MKKYKYNKVRTSIKTQAFPTRQKLKCIICLGTIRHGQLYRPTIGREAHDSCVLDHIDSEGYVSFTDQGEPIKGKFNR